MFVVLFTNDIIYVTSIRLFVDVFDDADAAMNQIGKFTKFTSKPQNSSHKTYDSMFMTRKTEPINGILVLGSFKCAVHIYLIDIVN